MASVCVCPFVCSCSCFHLCLISCCVYAYLSLCPRACLLSCFQFFSNLSLSCLHLALSNLSNLHRYTASSVRLSFVCLSVYLVVSLYVRLSISLSACMHARLSVGLSSLCHSRLLPPIYVWPSDCLCAFLRLLGLGVLRSLQ